MPQLRLHFWVGCYYLTDVTGRINRTLAAELERLHIGLRAAWNLPCLNVQPESGEIMRKRRCTCHYNFMIECGCW